MRRDDFQRKHNGLTEHQIEMKWRSYLYEQQLMMEAASIATAAAAAGAGGAGLQTSLPKYFLYGGSPIYEIESYTSGTSTIDFINNGGDDWDIGFKITPDTVQSTANIVGYQYSVNFWNSGVHTPLSGGFKTTDFTFNTAGNGSGVYELSQLYIFDDSSTFYTYSLFKVNASGTVIAYVKMQGITVNSTSGIDINATANVSQYGVSYPLQWISFDTFPPTVFNPIGNTTTINVALPIDAIGVGCIAVLDSVFTNDITDNHGVAISLIIS